MAHARQQIRGAVVDAIKSAVAEVDNRVYPNRVKVLADIHLPAVCVYTMNETQERLSNEVVQRSVDINIECVVKESDTYDNTLDDIAVGVETALKNVSNAGTVVQYINPVSHEITMQIEGEKPIAKLTILAQAVYTTAFGVADVIT